MLSPSRLLQQVRAEHNLSQRVLARLAPISFRQLQRVEQGWSDITVGKLDPLLRRFGLELAVKAREPKWKVLCYFGLPMAGYRPAKSSVHQFLSALAQACAFFSERGPEPAWARHFDALKALLFALQIHYPTLYARLRKRPGPDFEVVFRMDEVEGRHIKLRNIALPILCRRLRGLTRTGPKRF